MEMDMGAARLRSEGQSPVREAGNVPRQRNVFDEYIDAAPALAAAGVSLPLVSSA